MKAIYKRELKSYFQSMIGYAFIAFLLAFVGIYFMAYNLNAGYPYFFLRVIRRDVHVPRCCADIDDEEFFGRTKE